MGVTIAVVQAACDTAGGGTQDITTADLGGLTPTAAMFIYSRAATLDSASDGGMYGVGFTDGTNEFAFAWSSEHNVDTSNTHKRAENDELISFTDPADNSVDGEAAFSAFIENGVRIAWGDYPAAAYYVTVIFFAGTDVTAYCDEFTMHATEDETVDITDPGFEPDVVLFAYFHQAIPGTAEHRASSVGVAVNDGADTQASWFSNDKDNVGTTESQSAICDHYALNRSITGYGVEIGTFDADGFSATTREAGVANIDVAYLALNFNSAIAVGLDILTTPTSTGNEAFTVTLGGETPQACLFGLTQCEVVDTLYQDATAGTIGLYACDADDEASHAVQNEDNQDTSDTQSYAAAKLTLDADSGAGLFDASFVSFAANTVTLNFAETGGTAYKWWCLSFGAGSAAATAVPVLMHHYEQMRAA